MDNYEEDDVSHKEIYNALLYASNPKNLAKVIEAEKNKPSLISDEEIEQLKKKWSKITDEALKTIPEEIDEESEKRHQEIHNALLYASRPENLAKVIEAERNKPPLVSYEEIEQLKKKLKK